MIFCPIPIITATVGLMVVLPGPHIEVMGIAYQSMWRSEAQEPLAGTPYHDRNKSHSGKSWEVLRVHNGDTFYYSAEKECDNRRFVFVKNSEDIKDVVNHDNKAIWKAGSRSTSKRN
jgi:hypothetical protein